ncbi:hypothetical protein BV25DRAFT_1987615 [Artomyces pyxidatus]|uniref:Uncharacterized protein n=1 Tax=Artomyces pyxidatus TaxID=48021 RepID=A0ACB8TFE2_9AGAM|nr:hypothetical protein BV25DRAFT_1987615 [Artomyces pyxidatus]
MAAPTAPSLANFKFNTIGQSSALELRIGGDAVSEFRSPSPEDKKLVEGSTSFRPLSRPSLLQILGTGGSSDTKPPLPPLLKDTSSSAGNLTASIDPSSSLQSNDPRFQSRQASQPMLDLPSLGGTTEPSNHMVVRSITSSVPVSSKDPQTSSRMSPSTTSMNSTHSQSDVRSTSQHSTFPRQTVSSADAKMASVLASGLIPILSQQVREREEVLTTVKHNFESEATQLTAASVEASTAIQALLSHVTTLKLQAEQTRAQADHMFVEAVKTRELAENLLAAATDFQAHVERAHGRVIIAGGRSEETLQSVRGFFTVLDGRRNQEQDVFDSAQSEIARWNEERRVAEEEAREELVKAQNEAAEADRLANGRRKELEKLEAERREEQKRRVEIAQAEKDKREYESRRAAVMEAKQRANEENAARIRAEREGEDIARAPAQGFSGAVASVTLHATSTSALTPHISSAKPSLPPVEVVTQTVRKTTASALHSPVSISPHASLPPRPAVAPPAPVSSSRNQTNASKISGFVPAQTEAGRQVNTDMPFGTTTLASELHAKRIASGSTSTLDEARTSRGKRLTRPARKDAPNVTVKREPSTEAALLRTESPHLRTVEQTEPTLSSAAHASNSTPSASDMPIDPRLRDPRRTAQDRNGSRNQSRAVSAGVSVSTSHARQADSTSLSPVDDYSHRAVPSSSAHSSDEQPQAERIAREQFGQPPLRDRRTGPGAAAPDPRAARPAVEVVRPDVSWHSSSDSRGRRLIRHSPLSSSGRRLSPVNVQWPISSDSTAPLASNSSRFRPGDHYSPPRSSARYSSSPDTTTVPRKRPLARNSYPDPTEQEPPRSKTRRQEEHASNRPSHDRHWSPAPTYGKRRRSATPPSPLMRFSPAGHETDTYDYGDTRSRNTHDEASRHRPSTEGYGYYGPPSPPVEPWSTAVESESWSAGHEPAYAAMDTSAYQSAPSTEHHLPLPAGDYDHLRDEQQDEITKRSLLSRMGDDTKERSLRRASGGKIARGTGANPHRGKIQRVNRPVKDLSSRIGNGHPTPLQERIT